jgi:hypothetical protein
MCLRISYKKKMKKNFCFLKVAEERSRIQIRYSVLQIRIQDPDVRKTLVSVGNPCD